MLSFLLDGWFRLHWTEDTLVLFDPFHGFFLSLVHLLDLAL